jgi:hypothetical protein
MTLGRRDDIRKSVPELWRQRGDEATGPMRRELRAVSKRLTRALSCPAMLPIIRRATSRWTISCYLGPAIGHLAMLAPSRQRIGTYEYNNCG